MAMRWHKCWQILLALCILPLPHARSLALASVLTQAPQEVKPASLPAVRVHADETLWQSPWFQRFVEHLRQGVHADRFQPEDCKRAHVLLYFSASPPCEQSTQAAPASPFSQQSLGLPPQPEVAYAYLQHLGFRFWHPLAPVAPAAIPADRLLNFSSDLPAPRLKRRGFLLHTMHPLELTHVLNGWGLQGPEDEAGWRDLLPQWERYLEWLVAHRQNKVEWVLLEKGRWRSFSRSSRRQKRLRELVEMAHDWGIEVGVDAPMALQQQNGWRLVTDPSADLADTEQQIEGHLGWLMGAGFDFVGTEMGSTEFSNSGAQRMVHWLNHATDYLSRRYHKKFTTKVHISSGQTTEAYPDPDTGEPLNFNFLPFYADPRLGVLPHTVQVYALDDPAPTYGQQDFQSMLRFMQWVQAANTQNPAQHRSMYWYPETAYWVNYDNTVPLFLPVYAHRRLHDLHLIADAGVQLDGQMVFSSGWSWGYWLSDLLSAESVVQDPLQLSEADGMKQLLLREFDVLGTVAPEVVQLLQDTMQAQYELLILGEHHGLRPETVVQRNGMAYLSGQETWSQLGSLIRQWGLTGFQTQPDRLTFHAVAHDEASAQFYREAVRPLLQDMDDRFSDLARRADQLGQRVPAHWQSQFASIQRGLWINAYRTRFVQALFEASLGRLYRHPETTARYVSRATQVLQRAQAVVQAEHQNLITPWVTAAPHELPNPTAYSYGYLWPAADLFYWKRDLVQVEQNNVNPCLMSLIDPLEVAFPDPEAETQLRQAREVLGLFLPLRDCLFY